VYGWLCFILIFVAYVFISELGELVSDCLFDCLIDFHPIILR
jgi:hypothetical protein